MCVEEYQIASRDRLYRYIGDVPQGDVTVDAGSVRGRQYANHIHLRLVAQKRSQSFAHEGARADQENADGRS